jgi:NhaP-type Na+/H+ or K+/H+ antiporter
VIFGGLLAAGLLDDLPWALAGFLGAALAPTDAALSVQVINDERIPMRPRRALNVESGLNDGIATPIVTVMLAVAASQLGIASEGESVEAGAALRELGAGVVVGLVLGYGGAKLITWAARHTWIVAGGRRLATLGVAISAFAVALAIDGNGFIAAFVAGIAFGARLDDDVADIERVGELPELGGELLGLVVWFLFGATLIPVALEHLDAPIVAYALASLTIVRMLPVALCMARSGLDRPSVLFIAWFGPRGLASVVFALLAIEELGETSPLANQAVAAVALTVLLSVVLHGVTAGPGGRRYVQRERSGSEGALRARPSVLSDIHHTS